MRALAPAGILIVALLAGCASPAPSPSAGPSDSPSATATPSATPDVTAEPLGIPDCDTLLPLPLAQSLFSPQTEAFGELDVVQFGVSDVPAVADAVAGASLSKFCGWGVPNSDGAFTLLIAEITPADRASVEAALTAAGFTAVTMGTVTGYDAEREGEVSTLANTLLFTGDVMIVCNGTSLDLTGAVTGSALDALRTANPSLSL